MTNSNLYIDLESKEWTCVNKMMSSRNDFNLVCNNDNRKQI